MDIQSIVAIRHGECVYNNTTGYRVKIIKWHILYGTGDYEDPPEIRDNQNVECYYVFYEDIINKGNFNVSGGGFLHLEEAVNSVEANVNVKWFK